MTQRIRNINIRIINEIVTKIRSGGVICCPTDTVFGILAAADNDEAIKKIYNIKKRNTLKSLPILIHNISQLDKIAYVNYNVSIIAEKFLPGPLTIIVKIKSNDNLSKNLNINNNTLAFRIPNHPIILEILKCIDQPLACTSANISGTKDSIDINNIIDIIDNKLDMIITCGTEFLSGQSSTIIDLTQKDIVLVRQGSITLDEIKLRCNIN